jgi:hypothetical protein
MIGNFMKNQDTSELMEKIKFFAFIPWILISNSFIFVVWAFAGIGLTPTMMRWFEIDIGFILSPILGFIVYCAFYWTLIIALILLMFLFSILLHLKKKRVA